MAQATPPVTAEQYLEAERQVIAGVFARLLPRYRTAYGEELAAGYAMAVTNILFSLPPQAKDQVFLEAHRQAVDTEVQALAADREIREAVTETVTMRIVFGSRVRGCNAEDLYQPAEELKRLGLFLPGATPPSPRAFLQRAEAFLRSAPWG